MTRRLAVTLASAATAALLALPSRAQDAPKAEALKALETIRPPERRAPGPMLRVQVVIARFKGENKIASLPYTFSVTVEGRTARMRMGVDTPVAVTTAAADASKPATTSFQYRNVGTNIDCTARDAGDGRYLLQLAVENSSAYLGGPLADANASGSPLFRRFDTNIESVLRDGQTIQTIASTDPVTGEVVKIDVTLNVIR
jgi:hypothetical protein